MVVHVACTCGSETLLMSGWNERKGRLSWITPFIHPRTPAHVVPPPFIEYHPSLVKHDWKLLKTHSEVPLLGDSNAREVGDVD